MKLPSYRRLNKSDYKEEFQPLVEQMSYSLNSALESVLDALNGKLTFGDNISSQLKEFTIKKGGTAKVSVPPNTKINGLVVIYAMGQNQETPESAVFCSFIQKDTTVEIVDITGLKDNITYTVRIIIL